jgi:serine/threonine-protein kinase ULK2
MHRDLKLENIMVHFSEVPMDPRLPQKIDMKKFAHDFDFETKHETMCCKITDLGFARRLQEGDLATTGCGTPLLMAPEVMTGKHYNHKADVWSIGCLFYELLTGFMPFTGSSFQHLKQNMEKGIYKIPATIELSFPCVQFLSQCLKYDSDSRLSWQELCNHEYIRDDEYHSPYLQSVLAKT